MAGSGRRRRLLVAAFQPDPKVEKQAVEQLWGGYGSGGVIVEKTAFTAHNQFGRGGSHLSYSDMTS